MDWERKFASIVRETEDNLVKIREKVNGKMDAGEDTSYHMYKYRPPHDRSNVDYSSTRSSWLSLSDQTQIASSNIDTDPNYQGAQYPSNIQLHQRLLAQNKTIEKLSRLVTSMEKQRNQYRNQIDDLKAEIDAVSSRMMNQKPSRLIKRQIDEMKEEVTREIEILRNQMISIKAKAIHTPYSDSSSHFVTEDLRNMHVAIQEELHYLRRDLDILRSRIGSLEENVSTLSGQQELQRRSSLLNYDNRLPRQYILETLNTLPTADKRVEKLQLEHLRHAVGLLKDKIDSVEKKMDKVTQPGNFELADYKKKLLNKYSYRVDDNLSNDGDDDYDDDLDSLDIDDLDIDEDDIASGNEGLTEAELPESVKEKKSKVERCNENTSDLDDLDLHDNKNTESISSGLSTSDV